MSHYINYYTVENPNPVILDLLYFILDHCFSQVLDCLRLLDPHSTCNKASDHHLIVCVAKRNQHSIDTLQK